MIAAAKRKLAQKKAEAAHEKGESRSYERKEPESEDVAHRKQRGRLKPY